MEQEFVINNKEELMDFIEKFNNLLKENKSDNLDNEVEFQIYSYKSNLISLNYNNVSHIINTEELYEYFDDEKDIEIDYDTYEISIINESENELGSVIFDEGQKITVKKETYQDDDDKDILIVFYLEFE